MTVESAAEMARRLMNEIGEATQGHYTKGEVKTILNAIAGKQDTTTENTVEVDQLRRGDVFAGKLVGGKQRPWVVLSVRKGRVCAIAMSGSGGLNGARAAAKSECRFWPDSWLTATVSVFNEAEARKHVSRPYTNKAHLREVERVLGDILRLPRSAARRRKPRKALRVVSDRTLAEQGEAV